jgi:hypothetical protein
LVAEGFWQGGAVQAKVELHAVIRALDHLTFRG